MKLTDEELGRLDTMTAAAAKADPPLLPAPTMPGIGTPPTLAALVAYRRERLGRR